MSEKKRNVLFMILTVVACGAVFFALGLAVADRFGYTHKDVVIDTIVPETTKSIVLQECIDLNTATVETLMQLDGLGEKTAQNIIDYRESIGGFKYVEQLLYVTGIGETKYNRWLPYVTVNGVDSENTTVISNASSVADVTSTSGADAVETKITTGVSDDGKTDAISAKTTTSPTTATTTAMASATIPSQMQTVAQTTVIFQGVIDLNTATVDELVQLDGIGETTAKNIIHYRDRIGGFTSVEQLMDVDGIGETKFRNWCRYFTVNGVPYSGTAVNTTTTRVSSTTTATKFQGTIDLNSATVEDLMQIDGIGEKTAQNILRFRKSVGGFTSVEQLMEVEGIGETKFRNWCHYFTVNGVPYIGTTAHTTSRSTSATTTTKFQGKIDLNSATVEDLMQIDGIGEKTTQNILRYRESIGGFTSVEQLLDVEGIGEAKLNKWSPYLTVNGVGDGGTTTSTSARNTEKYHLNLVTKEELMSIRGVGEQTADAILQYREEIGGFTHLEQLLEIDGIGDGRFATLCEYLTLDDE